MASTYTAQTGVDFARRFIKQVPITDIDSQAADMASSLMWARYPWRWAMTALTAISLVDGQQDYTVSNNNVYRLLRLRLRRTDTTPDEYTELSLRNFLPLDLVKQSYRTFQVASYDDVTSKIRLPSAVELPTGTTIQIEGDYQKNPTKIGDGQLADVLWFPDQYFPVFAEGVLYFFYKFTDDSRAGTVQFTGGRSVYTGQFGVFMTLLEEMAKAEDYGDGAEGMHPAEPLGVGYSYSGGIFG